MSRPMDMESGADESVAMLSHAYPAAWLQSSSSANNSRSLWPQRLLAGFALAAVGIAVVSMSIGRKAPRQHHWDMAQLIQESELPVGAPPDLQALLFAKLGQRAEQVAPEMTATEVVDTLSSYVKLWEPKPSASGTSKSLLAQPGKSLLKALGKRARQVMADMGPHEVATVFTAYAGMGEQPDHHLREALGQRTEEVAGDMTAHEVTSVYNAYAELGKEPSESLLSALGRQAERKASDMDAQAVCDVLEAYVAFEKQPDESLFTAVGLRAEKLAGDMGAKSVSKILNAYGTFEVQPSESLWSALGRRAQQVAPLMDAKDVVTALGTYAKLNHQPERPLLAALGQRLRMVVDQMDAEDVASTLVAYAKFEAGEAGEAGTSDAESPPAESVTIAPETVKKPSDAKKASHAHSKHDSPDSATASAARIVDALATAEVATKEAETNAGKLPAAGGSPAQKKSEGSSSVPFRDYWNSGS
eukprot:TRINITY_DN90936_c0_g1_i1.p1 TRINITY_DN90936_c0_g1~~TRINITY_DN90936_c0_g1_i1.p1  ORF type:complete len:474 (+),score=102.69 TRINITY_DN90936_c0_g1_i1:77-1498(+)